MPRQLLGVLVGLVSVMLCVPAFAQGTYKGRDTKDERTYVLVEITGFDVNCSSLPSQQDVNKRVEELKSQNSARAKDNKPVLDEIKKLTAQVATKKRELASAKDDAAKQEVQKAMDDLNSQIASKKSEVKLLTTWQWPPKHFNKYADAQKFVDEVYKEAQAAKEKAQAKEAAAESESKKNP